MAEKIGGMGLLVTTGSASELEKEKKAKKEGGVEIHKD